MDPESRAWVSELTSNGPVRDDAIARLHALMLRMARSEAARRAGWHGIRGAELDDLADQAADDAVVSILRKVREFRGDSRFTTWACAFAIHEVSGKFGRHVWARDGVQLDDDGWRQLPARLGGDPASVSESRELVVALRAAVEQELTSLQRRVFIALVVDGVPLDVLVVASRSSWSTIGLTGCSGTVALRVPAAPSRKDLLSALPIAAPTGSNGRSFATIVAINQPAQRYRPEILRPTRIPIPVWDGPGNRVSGGEVTRLWSAHTGPAGSLSRYSAKALPASAKVSFGHMSSVSALPQHPRSGCCDEGFGRLWLETGRDRGAGADGR